MRWQPLIKLTNGRGADVSFEAVGMSVTVDLALRCLRKGGAATLVGNVSPKIEFPLQVAVTRELSIYGSCASRGEYTACLDMLARGDLKAEPSSAPQGPAGARLERLYRGEPGLLQSLAYSRNRKEPRTETLKIGN